MFLKDVHLVSARTASFSVEIRDNISAHINMAHTTAVYVIHYEMVSRMPVESVRR